MLELIKSERGDSVIYDFSTLEFESDFEFIVSILSSKFDIQIIEKFLGPGTTIWNLKIDNYLVNLVNNTWGNFIKPENKDSENFLEIELHNINGLFSKSFK